MNDGHVSVPVDPAVLADLLDAHGDYRVQRRLTAIDRKGPPGAEGGLVGVALDVETTGLDPDRHEVIELALQKFRLDAEGRIVETGRPRSWLEQPSRPIPAQVTRITGLVDGDVEGRAIADGEATALLLDADFVVAHNSAFDRRFVERRLPLAAGRPWACSLADVNWRAEGFEGRRLSELLGRMGWFYEAHRAAGDVAALLRLLDHELADGRTVAARMMETARRPSWIVEAVGAAYEVKDLLRERGYRWNGAGRVWSTMVPDDKVADEVEWAKGAVYMDVGEPSVRRVSWTERYA